MKTVLYIDTTDNEVMTLDDIRQRYIIANNSDLPISDTEMEIIILTSLTVNHNGVYQVLNNKLVDWCNAFADYQESDRYYSQDERDENIRDYYTALYCRGDFVEEIKNIIGKDNEGLKLLKQLDEII